MRHFVFLAAVVVLASCGSASTVGRPSSPIVDFTDTLSPDDMFFKDLDPGDTVGHFVYIDNPFQGGSPTLYGRAFRAGGRTLVQRWQQCDWWYAARVDTIWVWEGTTRRPPASGRPEPSPSSSSPTQNGAWSSNPTPPSSPPAWARRGKGPSCRSLFSATRSPTW